MRWLSSGRQSMKSSLSLVWARRRTRIAWPGLPGRATSHVCIALYTPPSTCSLSFSRMSSVAHDGILPPGGGGTSSAVRAFTHC